MKSIGSRVEFHCNENYTEICGKHAADCQSDRTWSYYPQCKRGTFISGKNVLMTDKVSHIPLLCCYRFKLHAVMVKCYFRRMSFIVGAGIQVFFWGKRGCKSQRVDSVTVSFRVFFSYNWVTVLDSNETQFQEKSAVLQLLCPAEKMMIILFWPFASVVSFPHLCLDH